jgi:hypothetical protein
LEHDVFYDVEIEEDLLVFVRYFGEGVGEEGVGVWGR